MIDFSALPLKKAIFFGPKLYLLSIVSLFTIVGGVSIYYISGGSSEIVFTIVRILAFLFIAGLTVSIPIFVIWFFKDLLLPRYRRVRDGQSSYSPAYDRVVPLEKFADDNGFVFTQYPAETPAPYELFHEIMSPGSGDDIYILHKLDGKVGESNVSFYCLAYASANAGNIHHKGGAYAFSSDGRTIDYMTVLMTDGPVGPSYTQTVYKSTSTPYAYIRRDGQVTDRDSAQEMFGLLDDAATVQN